MTFPISRRELAMHFFPSPTYGSAVKKMKRWIQKDKALETDLLAANCFPGQKQFSKTQYQVFQKYLSG